MDAAGSKRPFRAPTLQDVNLSDFEEQDSALDDGISELADQIYEFVVARHNVGDPCRWRCLITEFGGRFGANAHYKISYAVGKLRTARKVTLVDDKIPERIVPWQNPRQLVKKKFNYGGNE